MKDLTSGNPMKSLFFFSLPVIGGNLFQLFYTLADTLIVGQTMGAAALAAVGATSIIIYFILCFIQGITSGFGILIGQAYGAKDEELVRKYIAASTLLSLGFTLVLTVIICVLAVPILHAMQTPADIFQEAYDYMIVIFIGTGATMFYNMISNIARALGDSKSPLICLIISSILNIVLDLVLILNFHMGVTGAALATVVSQLISALLCTGYLLLRFPVMHLKNADWQVDGKTFAKHLAIGFPMGFQMSVMCIGQLAMQTAVNGLGTNAIAGYTAASKLDQFSVLINNAFSMTIASYVAQNYGAGLLDRIKKGVTGCFALTTGANLLMTVFMLSTQSLLVPLFVNEPNAEIFSYAARYVWLVSPFYVVLGIISVYRSAIQSMGNTLCPFAACMVELVLRLISASGLSVIFGYTAICLSHPFAWAGASLVLLPVYFHMIRHSALAVKEA